MCSSIHVRMAVATTAILLMLAFASPVSATPNMIRLGYPTCAACHVSPQGGGLLTRYGEGIDLAQTLRPEEPNDPELGEDGLGSRLNYDVRLSLGVEREPPADSLYGFNMSFRSAIGILPNHRLVYSSSIRTPNLARTRTSGAITVGMSRLYWLYQARPGLSLMFGRDDLPSGVQGSQSFGRRVNNPSVSSAPTQAKVFWWNNRWQVTAYGFGPDGNETAPRFRAYGAGGVVGANVWRDRAVLGVQTRLSRADAFDRANAGLFARLGLSKNWGILVEHDVTQRKTDRDVNLTHLAGKSEVFFVPFDWLQTSLSVDHVTTSGGSDMVRFSPGIEARITPNIKLSFDVSDTRAATNSRTYSIGVQVKTQ